jgi:hypothetical protein
MATNFNNFDPILRGDDVAARKILAADPKTPPEVLYFLATDSDRDVRIAVAENGNTPNQAAAVLAKDAEVPVRCALARTAVGDGLDTNARRDLWRMGFTILETLLCDQVVKVRKVLSEALCAAPDAPHDIVVGLARDSEQAVAVRVLEQSPVLTDDDIATIIEDGAPDWAQSAIAAREAVSSGVSDVIIDHAHTAAVARVIQNPGSQISDPALGRLVDRAEQETGLQEALVERPGLSGGMIEALARFVSAPLLSLLCGRVDLDEQTAQGLNRVIEARPDKPKVVAKAKKRRSLFSFLGKSHAQKDSEELSDSSSPGTNKIEGEDAARRARRLFEAGKLTSDAVSTALDRKERDFAIEAIALLSGLMTASVRRMVDVGSPRTMVALSWKAGFTARFSMDLQRQLGEIKPNRVLNARDGLDYPMTASAMREQLSMFR